MHIASNNHGREVVVAIGQGALDPGLWEQILDGEIDSPAAQTGARKNSRRVNCNGAAMV